MFKQILRFRVVLVIFLVLAVFCSDAFAWGGGGGRHYYRGGRWYRHGWLGFDIAISALAIGALIDSLPPRCTRVVYAGVPYYYCDGYYYRPYYGGGYVVVQPPVAVQPVAAAPEVAPVAAAAPEVAPVAAPAPATAAPVAQPQAQTRLPETLIVNIPNSKGEYTKVTLKKSGNGFVGPQGEYYEGHPTVEQLKVLYGK